MVAAAAAVSRVEAETRVVALADSRAVSYSREVAIVGIVCRESDFGDVDDRFAFFPRRYLRKL